MAIKIFDIYDHGLRQRISGFPQFCFTYGCLRTLLTLFYDYYSFESMVLNACKCGMILSNTCTCLHLFPSSIRSFYFVKLENNKLDVGVVYEKVNHILLMMVLNLGKKKK